MDEPAADTAATTDAAPPGGAPPEDGKRDVASPDEGDGASTPPERERAAPQSRTTTDAEWEVFLRETEREPLRHVGSVTAPTAETAAEAASRLFDRFARDLWLYPAEQVVRYSTDALAGSTEGQQAEHATGADG